MGKTEGFTTTADINTEIQELRLELLGATGERSEQINGQIQALLKKKMGVSASLSKLHEKMHEAAEVADKAGYTGKGAKDD